MPRTIRFSMATQGLAQIAAGLYPLLFNAPIEGFWRTIFTAVIVSAFIVAFLLIAVIGIPIKSMLKIYVLAAVLVVVVYVLQESHRIMLAAHGPLFLTNLLIFVVSIGSGGALLLCIKFAGPTPTAENLAVFENPTGNWEHRGDFSVELVEGTETTHVPASESVMFKNGIAYVTSGKVQQCIGGIQMSTAEMQPFYWGYSSVKVIRDGNGKLLWVNHDFR
jgi:hypothetical protein